MNGKYLAGLGVGGAVLAAFLTLGSLTGAAFTSPPASSLRTAGEIDLISDGGPVVVDSQQANIAGGDGTVFQVGQTHSGSYAGYAVARSNGLGVWGAWQLDVGDPEDALGSTVAASHVRWTGYTWTAKDTATVGGWTHYDEKTGAHCGIGNAMYGIDHHDAALDGGVEFRIREGVSGGPGGTRTVTNATVVNGGYWQTFAATVHQPRALITCDATIEGAVVADVLSGGTNTGHRTRLCACTSDGAASPAYAWRNMTSGTVGSSTTCSD